MYIDTTVLNNHVKTPLNLPYDFILRTVYAIIYPPYNILKTKILISILYEFRKMQKLFYNVGIAETLAFELCTCIVLRIYMILPSLKGCSGIIHQPNTVLKELAMIVRSPSSRIEGWDAQLLIDFLKKKFEGAWEDSEQCCNSKLYHLYIHL